MLRANPTGQPDPNQARREPYQTRKLGWPLLARLTELVKRLTSIAGLKEEADSIETRLKKMLQRLRWLPESKKIDERVAGRIVSSLAELIVLAEHAMSLNWIKSPISRSSLGEFASESTVTVVDNGDGNK